MLTTKTKLNRRPCVPSSGWATAVAVPTFMVLAVCTGVPPARAEEAAERWLMLSTHHANNPEERTATVLAQVASELRRRQVYPIAFEEASALTEALVSSSPAVHRESDLDVVAREAQRALVHVATGESKKAIEAVKKVMDRAETALESLNREAGSARHVLNACLYLVRALIDTGEKQAAFEKVMECRRLVPDIDPDPYDHPPSVVSLVREAERQLEAEPRDHTLHITSEPQACEAFVNGRNLGATPLDLPALAPGSYRVQVECGEDEPGRVHRVVLKGRDTRLHIDTIFDRAIQTGEGLALAYADAGNEYRRRFQDALTLGSAMETPTVLLFSAETEREVRIDRIEIDRKAVTASVWLKGDPRAEATSLKTGVSALLNDRSGKAEGNRLVAQAAWLPPASAPRSAASLQQSSATANKQTKMSSSPRSRRARRKRASGWTLGGLGVASLAAGWGMYAQLRSREARLEDASPADADFVARQDEFDRARLGVAVSAAVGGTLLTVGEGLVLAPRKKVPWWSWTLGAGGLGITAAAVVQFARSRDCLGATGSDLCARQTPWPTLGGLLLAHGVPLMAMPVFHLIKRSSARPAAAQALVNDLRLESSGAGLALRGTLR